MGQLQEIEQAIAKGDTGRLDDLVENALARADFDMLYEAAGMLMGYGFIGHADMIYKTLLEHLPDEAQLKIDHASALLELGEEDEALLLLTEITPEDEEYVQALLVLADYYQMTGMLETAVAKVREALLLMPENPVIRFAYAELLLTSGKYVEAAAIYEELQEEGNDEIGGITLISRLAETYSSGAAFEEAIPYYEQMLEDSILPDTLFGAAYACFQSGRVERAAALSQQLLDIDPDYFSAYMLAGQAFARTGDDKKAYDLFTRGIKRDEYDKQLRLAAGKSALKLGLTQEAEKHLSEALVLDPEYIDALMALVSLYNQEEKYEEVLEALASVQLDIPMLAAFRAYAQEGLELYKDAYASYVEAYAGMKEDPAFLDRYAKFLLEEGKRGEAIEIVKELLSLAHDDEWAAFLELSNDEEV